MLTMLEQVPYGVAENLIHKMSSAEFLEFGQIHGVTDELEKLRDRIESINDVLLDADDKQQRVNVRIWIKRLKEVLYRADDFMDDLAIEDMRRKAEEAGQGEQETQVFHSYSSSNRISFPIQMTGEIIEIQKAFDDVVEDMFKLNLCPRAVVVKKANSEWRETSSFVLESNIFGRDDSKKEIISLLLRQPPVNRNVPAVIAIVGIAGLGKTSLAQLVYNDLEVQNFFEKQMWVCVSDNFDVKTLLKKILESATGSQIEDRLSLENLQNKLRQILCGKKYLVVLDDVWNENYRKWDELRTYLACGALDSKVLVTTRSKTVANTMGAHTPYCLRGLTDDESWSLLKKITFDDDVRRVNVNLESVGKGIAEKCKGVPLAIKTLGGMLRQNNEESEWEDVLKGDFWKLCDDQESIMPILKLSYQHLSPQLRQCFAYCSLYPKDSVIDKNDLIQLWMAQGYLNCTTEKVHMEDIGNRFVKFFLMNSYFQDAEESAHGEIISFQLHDLMHDLAMLVAGSDYCYLDSEAKRLVGRPMHVSLEYKAIPLLKSVDASRLRTLILWSYYCNSEEELSVISDFKYLRVLKMSYCSLSKLPKSIWKKMKHLRYIDFSCCVSEGASLPKSMGNLICLQTLKLDSCEEEFFREVVTKLVNLRCLHFEICGCFENGIPVGLGKLCSLQSWHWPHFVIGEFSTLNELKDLHYLRGKLTIRRLNLVKDVALESQNTNLKEKSLLQSLILEWGGDHLNDDIDNLNSDSFQLLENLCPHHNLKQLHVESYPGVTFPNWLSFLTNIVEISFSHFSNCQSLPPLERLPSLKSLSISNLEELEYIYVEQGIAGMFYPSLESLILWKCQKLRGWWRLRDIDISDTQKSLPPFPHLSLLQIQWCPKLTSMPTFPNLKELRLDDCDVEPLIETLHTAVRVCSPSSVVPLSMLRELHISDVQNMQALPKGWMRNLISLEVLQIGWLNCETLEGFETRFQDDTIYLPSIKKISISYCENLKALPDWIFNLSSLLILKIMECDNLTSLSEGMTRLSNLQTLEIIACPLLKTRESWAELLSSNVLKIGPVIELVKHRFKQIVIKSESNCN